MWMTLHSRLCLGTFALFTRVVQVGAQNLTDEQVGVVSQRLAEGAQKSWELGTRTQTILELNATRYSVFSRNSLPPPSTPPNNLTAVLEPFFSIPNNVVGNRANLNNGTVGPQPLIPDASAADPASIGMSVLLANWTGQANGNASMDFAGAARDQLDYLLNVVPRTPDGAISHRVSEVQLWSDFVYMVPPFIAYYGMLSGNRTLMLEAYNQIMLYRGYLRDTNAQNKWKHVLLGQDPKGPGNDGGYWTTGNGWAAAGMLRVLATMRNSQFANTFKNQQKDLGNWVKEIHDGMYPLLDNSTNLWTNYPDVPSTATGNFFDTAGSALLASTVFRAAVMLNQFTHVPAAERIRRTLFSPSTDPLPTTSPSSSSSRPSSSRAPSSVPSSVPSSSTVRSSNTTRSSSTETSLSSAPTATSPLSSSTLPSSTTITTPSATPTVFEGYGHITVDGWLAPVVNPDSYGQEGSKSPESEAFALQLHSAWRDWIADGARGANGGMSLRFASKGVWMWVVCMGVVGALVV
ncbi:Six-hairpin glycosidase [Macrolepiota fuliginosa MF-IS2]|uniref:Six-hairpin glycosidase n=1 Tax=Macrolepiota fuliginosa MF-IS2 TaxID=1400762 RepID=A0A9P5X980_9AGAR|nr:Six-hairpin glycosidase [Macrolepiota fuliginosa MF-IS2]